MPSGQEPSAELRHEVGDQALRSLIGQAAIDQELRDLHIVVPDPVLVATPETARVPDANGLFDQARLEAVLRSQNMTEAGFLELMRGEMAQRQLLDAVTAGAQAPDPRPAPIYAARYREASADMAPFPIASAPEPAAPDEAARAALVRQPPGPVRHAGIPADQGDRALAQ